MNDETVIQEPTAQQETKTFTQADVDRIVADRLSRERAKYEGFEALKAKAAKYDEAQEAAKTDLQRAQDQANSLKAQLEALQNEVNTRNARDKVAAETGIPASLLTGATEEECQAQAAALTKWRGDQPKYPALNDKGEVVRQAGGATRDQFADWFSQNLSK